MIKTYSQRNLNPYSGQVQIAESEHARAVTMDGENWEIHFLRTIESAPDGQQPGQAGLWTRIGRDFGKERGVKPLGDQSRPRKVFPRFGILERADIEKLVSGEYVPAEAGLLELARYLLAASLPFPPIDRYEYWLLDSVDGSPLALIYSCSTVEEQASFPSYPVWTALPAAIMPVATNAHEQQSQAPPVNSRLESMVTERAGTSPRAVWFERTDDETDSFPPLLVTENWPDDAQKELCQRYLCRQAPRLLMLHDLSVEDRRRLEHASRTQPLEVGKYYSLYPDVADEELMKTIRVEARLRESMGEQTHKVKFRWS